jgi:hypothetical protein
MAENWLNIREEIIKEFKKNGAVAYVSEKS